MVTGAVIIRPRELTVGMNTRLSGLEPERDEVDRLDAVEEGAPLRRRLECDGPKDEDPRTTARVPRICRVPKVGVVQEQ